MTKGIRVAKRNKKASSKNPEELLYTSEALSTKVFIKDGGSVTTDSSGNASFLIQHGLDYPPVTWLYTNPIPSAVNDSFPMNNSWGFADNNFIFVTFNPGSTRVDIQSATANTTYQYKYFIFIDSAKND